MDSQPHSPSSPARWFIRVYEFIARPIQSVESEELRRRVHMVILLSGLHLMLIILAGLRFFWIDGEVYAPVFVQFALNTMILILIYAGRIKAALRFLITFYVISNLLMLFVSDLTNLLYVTTSFVVAVVLLSHKLRYLYALGTIALIVMAGYLTTDNPQYESITHENVVLFGVLSIISLTISTGVIEGDRRQIERQFQALCESEKYYRLLAENISDMVTLHTADGRFLYISPSYLKATGYSEEELLAMSAEDLTSLVHPDDLQRTRYEAHQQVLHGESVTRLEYRRRRKDGSYMWVQAHSRPIFDDEKNVIQIVSSSRNTTYRKQMEDTLQKTEERLQLVLKNASVIVAATDHDLRYTWVYNPHPDFDVDSVVGKRDDEIAHNNGTLALMQLKQQVIDTGLNAQADITFPLSDGAITYTVEAQPIYDTTGEVIGVDTVAFDITERKQLEEKLRLLDRAIRFSTAGIAIVDARDYQAMPIVYANSAFSTITGYEQSELIGQNIRILNREDRHQPGLDELRSAIREQLSTPRKDIHKTPE